MLGVQVGFDVQVEGSVPPRLPSGSRGDSALAFPTPTPPLLGAEV